MMNRAIKDRELKKAIANVKLYSSASHRGQYQHNLISSALRVVADLGSYEVANALVKELNLTKRFGIPTVESRP